MKIIAGLVMAFLVCFIFIVMPYLLTKAPVMEEDFENED